MEYSKLYFFSYFFLLGGRGGAFVSYHSPFIHSPIIEVPTTKKRRERKEGRKEINKSKNYFVYQRTQRK